MHCPVCDKDKNEEQQFHREGNYKYELPCQECQDAVMRAYEKEPKDAQTKRRHAKKIAEALAKKSNR